MLSLTCKAAIKAVIFLASRIEAGGKAGILEISNHIGENEHTVGKLLQKLVKEKIIHSAKGPNGGFYMTARQQDQPVILVVEAIDGKTVFDQCGLGLSRCSATHPCPIHDDYKVVRDAFKKMCVEKKILDLYGPVNRGAAYLTG